jgi:hypothetical protein
MAIQRPQLEEFRAHVASRKGLSIEEELSVIDYALLMEQVVGKNYVEEQLKDQRIAELEAENKDA